MVWFMFYFATCHRLLGQPHAPAEQGQSEDLLMRLPRKDWFQWGKCTPLVITGAEARPIHL